MKAKPAILAALAFTASTVAANAQSAGMEKITVGQLLTQNFVLVGSFSVPSGGAGVFLQNGPKLYFCFVSETRESSTVATQYCKVVE